MAIPSPADAAAMALLCKDFVPNDRRNDRIKLLEEILAHTKFTQLHGKTWMECKLQYALITFPMGRGWQLTYHAGHKQTIEEFKTIGECVDRILSKWW